MSDPAGTGSRHAEEVSAVVEQRPTVVVTGIGAFTPVGDDVASTWSALLSGDSGVRKLTEEWVDQIPVKIAARLAVDPVSRLERVEARRIDRAQQVALLAAREAWVDAGTPDVDPERLCVVVGSGIGGLTTMMAAHDIFKEKGWRRVSPYTVPMFMPNGPSATVELELGARGGTYATVSACASGAEALAHGLDLIRLGRADVVVAGGAEAAIHPMSIASFAAMGAMSTRNDEPERASRPFDKGRDGFIIGEGAGVVVLESVERAARRGAKVYAELAGAGISSDAYHIVQPDPSGSGPALAIGRALENAGMEPDQVGHINAHATSTPQGDIAEAVAIRAALGEAASSVVVSATKSMTGHLLGGAGGLESIATILALGERKAPPTANLDDPDDEVQLDIARGEARPLPEEKVGALNNSFGFGGHNVSLAFRRL